jgi:hypothetical protein
MSLLQNGPGLRNQRSRCMWKGNWQSCSAAFLGPFRGLPSGRNLHSLLHIPTNEPKYIGAAMAHARLYLTQNQVVAKLCWFESGHGTSLVLSMWQKLSIAASRLLAAAFADHVDASDKMSGVSIDC